MSARKLVYKRSFDVYFILVRGNDEQLTTEYNLCYKLMFLIYHGRNADPFINK